MVVKTQSGKFAQIKVLFFVVGFVKKEDDGNVRFAEVVRDALVDRCKVIPAVQHEEDEVRRFMAMSASASTCSAKPSLRRAPIPPVSMIYRRGP